MGFRVVRITKRCKLEARLGYMVSTSDEEVQILLDEISVVIIESQQVFITAALLSQFLSKKIKVIFCDSAHDPQGELIPYFGTYDSYRKLKKQLAWTDATKDKVWAQIIRQKIENQAKVLQKLHMEEQCKALIEYQSQVTDGDPTNREGIAAKQYFSALFGLRFDRRNKATPINKYLNYGYAVVVGAVNREISKSGYLHQLGIHHIGEENPFNLGYDLVEPLRPFVDWIAISKDVNDDNFKSLMAKSLETIVLCDDKKCHLDNAISDYAMSIFTALNTGSKNTVKKITFNDE